MSSMRLFLVIAIVAIIAVALLAQQPQSQQPQTPAQQTPQRPQPPVSPDAQKPAASTTGAERTMEAAEVRPKEARGFDLDALDKSAEPCQDFYQYACGGWLKANPLPADKSRYGRFSELAERNRWVLRDILEEASARKANDPARRQVGDFYAACMDEKAAEKKKAQPLQPFLKELAAVKDRAQLAQLIARWHRQGVGGLFAFYPSPDLKDSERMVVNFDQGGITLPNRDYYIDKEPKMQETRDKYVEHISKMLQLLGDPSSAAADSATKIMEFETALAQAQMDRVKRRDPNNRNNKMSAQQMFQLASSLELDDYLSALQLAPPAELNNGNPEFFKQVNALVEKTPLDDVKTYLRWKITKAAAPSLSSDFVNEDFRFDGQVLAGTKELEPRWKRCVDMTDGALGEALGKLYVDRTFGAEGKRRMTELVDALAVSLEADIKQLPWMTEETKKKALEKLAAFNRKKIGHPEKYRDYSSIKVTRSDFTGNILRANAFESARQLAKVGKPVDRSEWLMSPPTVNAYYYPPNTEIVFPAGILQPPFFDKRVDDATNYGAIGGVIGHEFTHGFDDSGRKFDAKGNLTDWWTAEDAKAFEERASCVADQYSSYVVIEDVKMNGRIGLGENTADNGGMRVAYMALQETLKKNPELRKQVDGFSPEQRFFLGWAQIWCENSTPEALRLRAKTGPHSVAKYRVIGPTSNMPEFQEAFSCKAGQPMVRENRCRVW